MKELDAIKSEVLSCQKCALCQHRHTVVFGEGCSSSSLMCIGEGPGYYEDMAGRPFVGASGQLLDKILDVCGFRVSAMSLLPILSSVARLAIVLRFLKSGRNVCLTFCNR